MNSKPMKEEMDSLAGELLDQEVLMVLPKRVIHQESPLPDDWNVDWIDQSAILKNGEEIIAEARLTDADDFGFRRPAICFEMSGEKEDVMKAFESLISRLALDYEKTPSRNPLYIKLSAQDLELIAKASRMGFISYFGEWKQADPDESEALWIQITEDLRRRFPG